MPTAPLNTHTWRAAGRGQVRLVVERVRATVRGAVGGVMGGRLERLPLKRCGEPHSDRQDCAARKIHPSAGATAQHGTRLVPQGLCVCHAHQALTGEVGLAAGLGVSTQLEGSVPPDGSHAGCSSRLPCTGRVICAGAAVR